MDEKNKIKKLVGEEMKKYKKLLNLVKQERKCIIQRNNKELLKVINQKEVLLNEIEKNKKQMNEIINENKENLSNFCSDKDFSNLLNDLSMVLETLINMQNKNFKIIKILKEKTKAKIEQIDNMRKVVNYNSIKEELNYFDMEI